MMAIAKAWEKYSKENIEGRKFSENQIFSAKKAFYAGYQAFVVKLEEWVKNDATRLEDIASVLKELREWSESLRALEEAVEAARKARGGCC